MLSTIDTSSAHYAVGQPKTQKTLSMVKNERMAGSVPSWNNVLPASHETRDTASTPEGHDSFGFFDILDMINPLHHVPILGEAYRAITGDEIKPSSRLVGGSVFGGPIGLAMGLVNMIAQAETGQDLGTYTLSKLGSSNHKPKPYEDLPISLLTFTV